MTAYQLAKAVNKELDLRGLKAIPPQMVYQYFAKGYIPTFESNGQRLCTSETAADWTGWYIGKRVRNAR
jgi:hypothetical protein